jgi:hypothetical protein
VIELVRRAKSDELGEYHFETEVRFSIVMLTNLAGHLGTYEIILPPVVGVHS